MSDITRGHRRAFIAANNLQDAVDLNNLEQQQRMVTPHIQPCPFCGYSKCEIGDDSDPDVDGRDWDCCHHFVRCSQCGAQGPNAKFSRETNTSGMEICRILWNKRAINAPRIG